MSTLRKLLGAIKLKKRTISVNRNRLSYNNRRRQLLKRVHQKVISRRQNFQIIETAEEAVPAS